MQTNPYFENYINNLQKEIFLLAYDYKYDIVSFITVYMKSDIRKEMDKPYTFWHNQTANRILEEVLDNNDIKKVKVQRINKDAVEWLGFFYSKWHFMTGESSKSIIKFLPSKEGLLSFYMLHQLDESEAIEICKRQYNLSRNNHRNNEYKNSKESYKKYDNKSYYSFLSVKILYKLNKNNIFNELDYIGDKEEDDYDFVDQNYVIGIRSSVIDNSNKTSIIDEFNSINLEANNYTVRSVISIYFCYINSSKYEEDDGSSKLLEEINTLKKEYTPSNRRFSYLYFYMNGKLYEITPTNDLYIYTIPISERDRAGIINKMTKYYLDIE